MIVLSENDVMVDVETLGTVPGCALLSIGACRVLTSSDFFYAVCSDPLECGLRANDSDTLRWWLGKNETARQEIRTNFSLPTQDVLTKFWKWLLCNFPSRNAEEVFTENAQVAENKPFRIWAYGADFDLPILRFAFHYLLPNLKFEKELWGYRKGRCLRTLFDERGRPSLERPETRHNALVDVQYQSQLLRLTCDPKIETEVENG